MAWSIHIWGNLHRFLPEIRDPGDSRDDPVPMQLTTCRKLQERWRVNFWGNIHVNSFMTWSEFYFWRVFFKCILGTKYTILFKGFEHDLCLWFLLTLLDPTFLEVGACPKFMGASVAGDFSYPLVKCRNTPLHSNSLTQLWKPWPLEIDQLASGELTACSWKWPSQNVFPLIAWWIFPVRLL